jgi:hypothetical protein
MADPRLDQQSCIWDLLRHKLGILTLDRLVMVAVDDPDRHGNAMELFRSEVRLGRPHLGDLIEERLILVQRWRKPLVFSLGLGDKCVEDRTLGDVLQSIRVGVSCKREDLCHPIRMMNGDVQSQDRSVAPADNCRLADLQKVHHRDDVG